MDMIEAPPNPHVCKPSANPRHDGRCDCGQPAVRDRNATLEAYLTKLAAEAAGFVTIADDGSNCGDDVGLTAYADYRAHPGGVLLAKDLNQEAREELADARNYLVWAIERIYEGVERGDGAAADDYERWMRTLMFVVAAWVSLHTPSA